MKKIVLLMLAVTILVSGCAVTSVAAISETKQALLTVEKSNAATALSAESFTGNIFLQNQPVPYKLPTVALSAATDESHEAVYAPEVKVSQSNMTDNAASSPEASEPEAPEIPEVVKPMIALTFDDGPARKITPQIIALLEEYDARATFCVVGNMLETRMDIGELIFQSGNEMIGHSWNHSYLTKLSASEIERQLLDTNALIEKITGSAPVFFRPPYGAVNTRVRETSEKLGMSLLLWSIDPKDWKYKNATVTYEHILENVKEGSIILCHDLYGSTVELVEMLLPELTRQGYRFVTVSELLAETEILPGKSYSRKK